MATYAFEGVVDVTELNPNGNEHNCSFATFDEAQNYGEAAKANLAFQAYRISLANEQGYTVLTGWTRPE